MKRTFFYGTVMMIALVCSCSTSRRLKEGRYKAITAPFILDSSQVLRVNNIGAEISTSAPEYAPSITANEKWLFFVTTRQRVSRSDHDIWLTVVPGSTDTVFSEPKMLASGINSGLNEGALTTSYDGTIIIFTGCNRTDGVGNCDLYEVVAGKDGTQQIRNIHELNSSQWESHPALSSDGKLLFFASNRFGTMGGVDIFMSRRNNDGRWSDPVNIGAPINTPSDEESPCLALGDSVLFFSSTGHGGLGLFDFFASIRQADSTWSEPRNLGVIFNSRGDDRFISVTPNGQTFYYASTRTDLPHAGDFDIFVVQTLNQVR